MCVTLYHSIGNDLHGTFYTPSHNESLVSTATVLRACQTVILLECTVVMAFSIQSSVAVMIICDHICKEGLMHPSNLLTLKTHNLIYISELLG